MSMPAEFMHPQPTLADLLDGYADAPPLRIQGIASDSRYLDEGYLFLAVQGLTSHGLDFLAEALEAGVSAVAWDASTGTPPRDVGIPMIAVDNLASRLGEIANRFYGRPSEQLEVIGVTGTNGKTTVAWMIARAAEILGEQCAYLGTLGYGLRELRGGEGMTTPATVELHGRLAEFVEQGAGYAAIEVSSHALAQGRIDGVQIDTAIFTNLSRDHLDYHDSMADYFASKARLFTDCAPRHRIINLDSDYGTRLASLCGPDVVTVSTNADRVANGRPYLFVRSVVATEQGFDISFISSWGGSRFTLPLVGDFNVANAATVLALLLLKGVALEAACDAMSQLTAPPGRMQRVAVAEGERTMQRVAVAEGERTMQRVAMDGPAVFVDYAHTPDALESALRALRTHCRGRLWCVFGCGGDRDAGKRPQMGKAAECHSSHVVITSDNPRSEPPMAIIDDILGGLAHPEKAVVIEDRAAAIAWAIDAADADDVVLIAGKGHETYQETNGKRVAFSDFAIAGKALAAREGVQ
jgi:UDP-N-acetylmuramoyl-L-alanyl-D-glutamate--2,6-diaminopimelate ligase